MKIVADIKGMNEAVARIRGLSEKKITTATVAALNDAARAGYEASRAEMRRVFDRPTPWVLGGVRYVKARKDKLESKIDFDFWGNKQTVTVEDVLRAEIDGGKRRNKRHEAALKRAGILPAGMQIVPGQAADMDAFGNMKSSQIVQIMSWLQAFGEQGYKANSTSETRARKRKGTRTRYGYEYFVVHPGTARTWQRSIGKTGSHKMQPGIYKRIFLAHGSAIKPVMIFVRSGQYQRRFDFYGVAQRSGLEMLKKQLPAYLKQMLAERGL